MEEAVMKPRQLVSAVASAVAVAAIGLPIPADAQQAILRVGNRTPPKSDTVTKGYAPWLRQVEKDSKGTLKFQEFWGGSIERSLKKQYEAMMAGLQDAGPIIPSYTAALFPDFSLFALPFMFTSAEEASEAAWRFYKTGMLRGLDDVYVAAVFTNDNGGLHFSEKLDGIDAIKGLKIRAAGPEEANAIRVFGGAPVSMGMGQVAEALNRGVVKGLLAGYSALRTFKVEPLLKTHVNVPMGVRGFFFGINKKKYDALPAAAKAAIDKNSGLSYSVHMGRQNDASSAIALAKAKKKNFITPTAAQMAEFKKKFQAIHDDWIKSTPDGRKKYDTLQKIIAEIRARKK
jgi:TRAP-type C4-dicarboxylate transport system substrate-binding protein